MVAFTSICSVTARVRHMGVSFYVMRFDHVQAHFTYDPQAPENAHVDATVQTDSLDVGASYGHQFANQQEERNRHQGFGIDAVEQLRHHRLQADGCERGADQYAGDECEGDGYAEIAEGEEQRGHETEQEGVGEDHRPVSRAMPSPIGAANPLRQPLTICSSENSATRAPQNGMAR